MNDDLIAHGSPYPSTVFAVVAVRHGVDPEGGQAAIDAFFAQLDNHDETYRGEIGAEIDILNLRSELEAGFCAALERGVSAALQYLAQHPAETVTNMERCAWTTEDGRRCQREAGHSEKKPHHADGVEGETCTCMLRWYPNRCKAHPENNQ